MKDALATSLMFLYQYWIGAATKEDGEPDYDLQKELIEKAMKLDDSNDGIMAYVTVIAMSDSEQSSWAKGIYDAFADSNPSYTVVSAIVETSIKQNDDETAKKYLEIQLDRATDAVKQTKRYAFSLNNMAYYLLVADTPEPKRAMELVNEALKVPKLTPEEKNSILHTKASAHMKLGEYEEAIAHLNIIREFRTDDEKYYEMLIECHQKVPNPQLPTIELLQAELQKIRDKKAAGGDG